MELSSKIDSFLREKGNKVKVSTESQGFDGSEGKKFFICLLLTITKVILLIIKQNRNSYFVNIKWILLATTKYLNIAGMLVKVYKRFRGRT